MVEKREKSARELGLNRMAVLFETLSRSIVGWRIDILYVDAKTAFDSDWDETLFRELEEAEKDNEVDHNNDNNGVVLTAHPLGYDLKLPRLNPNVRRTTTFIYGKEFFRRKRKETPGDAHRTRSGNISRTFSRQITCETREVVKITIRVKFVHVWSE